jgi:Coenzyme PQQ synthesis protein D (PqqD)
MSRRREDIPVISETVSTFVPDDGSDVVLFDSCTCKIHRLQGAAASVWAAVDATRSAGELVALVSQLHGVEVSTAANDIEAALDQLQQLGLITFVVTPAG